MNPLAIILAIICIWDSKGKPQVAFTEQPTMAVCQSNVDTFKKQLETNPDVQFVNVVCVELDKGTKA